MSLETVQQFFLTADVLETCAGELEAEVAENGFALFLSYDIEVPVGEPPTERDNRAMLGQLAGELERRGLSTAIYNSRECDEKMMITARELSMETGDCVIFIWQPGRFTLAAALP